MLNLPLKTLFIGQSFKLLPQCQSTNTELLNLVASNPALPEGFTLQAEHQTQGRGQRGNIWEAAPGQNLTFSVLLKPHFLQVAQQYWITISTSLAILDLLTELPLTEVKIKWPNDIFVEGNKIGGILIENLIKGNRIEGSVVGIGLNLNQVDFSVEGAGSIRLFTGQFQQKEEMLSKLLGYIEARYLQLRQGQQKWMLIKETYLGALLYFNSWNSYRAGQEVLQARITDIDALGRLILEDSAGLQRVYAMKEIQFMHEQSWL